MHAKTKIIAFVDIVGFTALVEAAEAAGGDFSRALELAGALGSAADSDRFKAHGPTTCPGSAYIQRDLDFQVTQISDCVVISVEVSPAGVSNLISHCFGIAINLLAKNALCRGYVTMGSIHHAHGQFIGTGYMHAYRAERDVAFLRADASEGGTPFIQIDQSVLDYVRDETDSCVRMMFERVTRSDGGYTAIYPFKALAKSPSAIITRDFDMVGFRDKVRLSIGYREENLRTLREAEAAAPDERDKAKVRHYARGMEEVIAQLRAKEAMVQSFIDNGHAPIGMGIA
ncbi:MAG TPA: hypothetical protein VFW13_00060 [Phenylobacterium sp.]|nr:hypothetical protein [Phenylobacterium sp.]